MGQADLMVVIFSDSRAHKGDADSDDSDDDDDIFRYTR